MSSKPKISVLAPDLSGGGGTRVYLVAKVLQKLNVNVEVVGFLFGEKPYPVPPENLPVKSIKGCRYPVFFRSIQQALTAMDGDIIYAIKPRPTSFGVGLIKHFLTKRPLMIDIDDWEMSWFGGDNWEYRRSWQQWMRGIFKHDGELRDPNHTMYLKQCDKWVPQADLITVNTDFLQKRYGGVYLPNGKDTDLFNPEKFNPQKSRDKYGLSNYRILMFPGTARPHKGIEDVIEALNLLNWPDLRLVLVGGRNIGDRYLDQLLEKGQPWIIKLPSVPLDQMPEVVSAAHIITIPQRQTLTASAQCPIKLSDGMAMAKPIIATNVGEIPNVLGNTGYLVESSSPQQIADQIEAIFHDYDQGLALGQQARERCIKYYSLTAMATALEKAIAPFL
ncbi:MAG: glycosyltransferase family 4 protein [Microcystaceae cyanobacterium]